MLGFYTIIEGNLSLVLPCVLVSMFDHIL